VTELDTETRALVLNRAGHRCEACGIGVHTRLGYSAQHRHPRGMGGTTARPWINYASNILVMCGSATTGCHGAAERRVPGLHDRGFWLKSGQVPADTPVQLFDRTWVELTDTGLYLPCSPPERTAA
jgi:hypothetical protein